MKPSLSVSIGVKGPEPPVADSSMLSFLPSPSVSLTSHLVPSWFSVTSGTPSLSVSFSAHDPAVLFDEEHVCPTGQPFPDWPRQPATQDGGPPEQIVPDVGPPQSESSSQDVEHVPV